MIAATRPPATEPSPFDARALTTVVAWLRPCDALGQALAIVVALAWLRIQIPRLPVAAGVGVLLLATPFVFWRLGKPWPISALEATGHVAFDILLLGWALYFTGGASNPFITLLLVPVALAAAALPMRAAAGVAGLAAAVYGVLVLQYVPLPDMPMHGSGFRLHLTGMTINFMLAVLLLAIFVGRTSAALHAQRAATQRLRERALRNEGILAIATQAADAAHRLNTPLSTLRTLLPELARGREADHALAADIDVMTGEVERCRAILRAMVDYGRGQLAGEAQVTTLGHYVDDCADRFRVLHPEAELSVEIEPPARARPITVQAGLAHALLNLLQNALDASRRNDSGSVRFLASADAARVKFAICDHGRGFPANHATGLAASSKPDGLGIGLALARATVERMHGEVRTEQSADGTCLRLSLPLAAQP
jgi:two-component system sensor histidine kinase RegB